MQQSLNLEKKVVSSIRNFASSVSLSGKVVINMSNLIEATSELPLTKLDYWERLIHLEFSNYLESTSAPKSKWVFFSKPKRLLTWLDLLSWDGYERERTLRTICGGAPNAFFFSMIIRRLNDWVPEVRQAAREKLPQIAKETESKYVAEALCIALLNLNSWGRIKDADKEVLLQVMYTKGVAELMKSKLIFSASGPLTFLFSQISRTPILDNALDDIAAHAIQPSVRAKAYRSLFEGRVFWKERKKWEWKQTDIGYSVGRRNAVISERKLKVSTPFRDLLQKSAIDRSSVVRRVSAEFLIRDLKKLGSEATFYAEKFASDTSKPVSERGNFALKRITQLE